MFPRNRQLLVAWFLGLDLLAVASAWRLIFPTSGQASTLPVVLLAAVAFACLGLYNLHRLRRGREELLGVLQATGLLLLLVLATNQPPTSQAGYGAVLAFGGLAMIGVAGLRRFSWHLIGSLRARGYNPTPAVIVGTGRVARRTARGIDAAGWTGIHVLGFIADLPNQFANDLPILGGIDDLPRLVHEHQISQVFIALPMQRYHEARRVFDILSQTLVEVRLVVDAPRMAALSLTTTNLDGLTIVGLRENPHHGINVAVKRCMDVTLATLALILLAPLLAGIALAIWWTSGRPILYRQERCGLNGQRFWMLKFRTMRPDAEAMTGPVWAQANDPRRTALGSFLRRTSLDELPQLLNVLWGEMSLVGPRPERPIFLERFRRTVPNYMARHAMQAGMTGWAQVHGWRGNTSLRQRVRHDLYYITHWNPLLDLRILWLTLWRGWSQKNAY